MKINRMRSLHDSIKIFLFPNHNTCLTFCLLANLIVISFLLIKYHHGKLGHLFPSLYTSYKDDIHLYPYSNDFWEQLKRNHAYQNMSPCCLTLDNPDKSQLCPDTLYWMLIGYCIISNFSRLPFQQSYWSA